MTLPIQTPQIGTTGVVKPPNIMDQIAPILEAINQQKLAQAQVENYRSLAEERKQKAAASARELQDQADAAKAFYDHLSGAAVRLKPEKPSKDGVPSHQGVDETTGSLIPLPQFERGLGPGALVNYHKLVEDYNRTVLQSQQETASRVQTQHTMAATDLLHSQAQAAADAIAADKTTQGILQGADLTSDAGQRGAIRKVLQTVGAGAAERLARTLNVGSGRYGHVIGPDGFLYITDSQSGRVRRDTVIGQRSQATQDALKRNAATLVDLLDQQSKLIHDLGIGASKNPTPAAVAEASRVLGVSTEGLSNWLRNDPEQLTRMLRTRFAHNYVGLLPHSRSSEALLQNLAESYWAPAGSSGATLQQAERDRRRLRAVLAGLANGSLTDMSRLPGFAQAAAAAAAEGVPQGTQPGTPPPNPDDWAQGIPPQ